MLRYIAFKTHHIQYNNYNRSDPESKDAFWRFKEVWQMSALIVVLGLGAVYGLYRFERWLTN